VLGFVGLNPSAADEERDDPTVSRLVRRARSLGCGGLVVANLCAWRTAEPRELLTVADPVGDPENARALRELLAMEGPKLAGWGRAGQGRGAGLRGAAEWWVLGLNADGSPRHPLYVAGAAVARRWG
jgi:hypothetical protein